MNTLVLDLHNLVSNHLTTAEDVFINYQIHTELQKLKTSVRTEDWKGILYFLQRYEYQKRILVECYLSAPDVSGVVGLIRKRYGLNIEPKSNSINEHADKAEVERSNLMRCTIKKIRNKWGIKSCYMKWIFGHFIRAPRIISELSDGSNIKTISANMLDYFHENYLNLESNGSIGCWGSILVILNRVDELQSLVNFTSYLRMDTITEQQLRNAILFASIRTDNLELFIKFFNSPIYDIILNNIFSYGAFKIFNYLFETYKPQGYTHGWGGGLIEDPRIARMLVSNKEFKILGLAKLIDGCQVEGFDVVAKILSTLN